ncbi:MAG TPA: hypothetical protein IAB49_05515 [Candidatus Caccenecus avistercoris]|nr:hypothetical protein [Candidatus Caccenecus avistercoris]
MLGKLLKYDLKWCFKPLVVFYILAIIFSIITRMIESVDQTLILLIMDKICSGVVIAMLINILINCLMRNWVRFERNIYKDESYLTHTLPVSKNKIYLSKILTAIITLFVSFIIIVICLAIVCLNDITWYSLKLSLEQSAIFLNSSPLSLIIVLIITIFFEFLFMILSGILGIVIGHRSNNMKIVKSILIGMGIYMGLSLFSLAIIYMAGILSPDIMSVFNNIKVSSNAIKSIMIIGIFVYAIYNLMIYFIGNALLNKGINVD